MNSTNVPSNKNIRNKFTAVAGTSFSVNERENEIQIPPKGRVFEAISNYVEEQGNIEIPVGNGKLNENGTLEMDNGNKVSMKNGKDAYNNVANHRLEKAKMNKKVQDKSAKVGDAR